MRKTTSPHRCAARRQEALFELYSIDVSLSQIIPLGHKFALRDIDEGEPVVKYGEVIGLAIQINVVRPTKAS